MQVCRLLYFPVFLALLSTACTRDPNVLKQKYLLNGDKYYSRGQFRQASILYRSALKQDARFGDAYLRLARSNLKLGLLSDASPSLARAVELLPENRSRMEARVLLADIYLGYLTNARYQKVVGDEASRLANELIAHDPQSFDGFYIRGSVASLDAADVAGKLPSVAKQRLTDAIADLRAADAIHPFESRVLPVLSRSLWASGDRDAAEKYLLAAIEHHKAALAPYSEAHGKELATGYLELYRLYAATGRQDSAEKILRQGIETAPGATQRNLFRAELAQLLQRLGRRAEMAAVLDNLKAHSAEFHQAFEISGEVYAKLGDFQQANREYDSGIAAFPKEKSHYQKLKIDALLAGNRRDEAEAVNDSFLRDNPKDADALARRAGFLVDKGDAEKSVVELEAMLRQAPASPAIRFNLGRAFMSLNQREAARQQFSQAIHFDPKFVLARIALAQIELTTGEYGRAVVSAEQIVALDDKNGPARLIRATALRQMGKKEEARAAFEALLAMYPKSDQALLQFAILNAMEGRTREAEALYRKSFEVNPGNLGGLLAIVQSQLEKNKPDEALQMVRAEAARYPDRADLAITLADLEMRLGHVDAAIAQYRTLLAKQTTIPAVSGDIHFRLGECYKRRGDLRAAVAELKQAQQILPNNAAVIHNLGVMHDMLGEKAEAKALYEAGLKIDGDDATVLNNLAFYMAQHGGDLDQALTYAQRARQKMPHDLAFADTVAVIYLKKNLVDNALDILQDLVGRQPKEATFHLHFGEALLRKGDTAKGKQELHLALANKPSAEDTAAIERLLSQNGA